MLNFSKLLGDKSLTVLGFWFPLTRLPSPARIVDVLAAFKTVTLKERTGLCCPLCADIRPQFKAEWWPGTVSGYTPFKHKSGDLERYLYTSVPSSNIDNSPEAEVPTHTWGVSSTWHIHMTVCVLVLKPKELAHYNMDESQLVLKQQILPSSAVPNPLEFTHRGRLLRGGCLWLRGGGIGGHQWISGTEFQFHKMKGPWGFVGVMTTIRPRVEIKFYVICILS